jgi:hypothetical protein
MLSPIARDIFSGAKNGAGIPRMPIAGAAHSEFFRDVPEVGRPAVIAGHGRRRYRMQAVKV